MRRCQSVFSLAALQACFAVAARMQGQSAASSSSSTADLNNLKKRVEAMEGSASLNALLSFYGNRQHTVLDMHTVVRRCMDPNYDTHLFCHKELPVLLAHHVRVLDSLPCGLSAMKSVHEVRKLTATCFQRLVHSRLPVCASSREAFIKVVEDIEEARGEADILHKMAMGVLELKEHLSRHTRARMSLKNQQIDLVAINQRLIPELRMVQEPMDECNRFFIYYNFLSRQLLNLQGQDVKTSRRIGTVDREVDLVKCVQFALEEAKQICSDVYGDCPDVKLEVPSGAEAMTFAHQTSTIHYILVELMKNAFRATVDAHMKRNSMGIVTCEEMPPVKVLVQSTPGNSHACVCISDEGGGIPRSQMPMVMSYTYTTASKPALDLEQLQAEGNGPSSSSSGHAHSSSSEDDDLSQTSQLAGYGFGLPMSRMYARSFGGDLLLQSMEGFGTKVFLFIKSSS